MALGTNIRRLREERGLTQADLAELAGCSAQAVAQWESKDTSPRADRLRRIANALGTTVDELLRGRAA